jgi:hypothetical protein
MSAITTPCVICKEEGRESEGKPRTFLGETIDGATCEECHVRCAMEAIRRIRAERSGAGAVHDAAAEVGAVAGAVSIRRGDA